MIIFIGSNEKGFFCEDIATKKEMKCTFIEENLHIANQIKSVMDYKDECKYVVIDIEQYADEPEEIVNWIIKLENALNVKPIIYASGYSPQAAVIAELYKNGIKNYIFSTYLTEKKNDLELCMNGYFEEFGYEERGITFDYIDEEEKEEEIIQKNISKAIGIAGAVARMGTTTQAIQFVKYLLFNGYKAAYIEMNNHEWVLQLAEAYSESEHDKDMGLVTYQSVDMYYKLDKLQDVLKKDYDFFIFDYGVYSERGFNKISFLEKGTQIFVVGSKPNEFDKMYEVVKNNFYNNCYYIFNFVPEAEQKDLKELMEEKAEFTFFADEARDPFTYCNSNIYEQILPIENKNVEPVKKSIFGRIKNGRM